MFFRFLFLAAANEDKHKNYTSKEIRCALTSSLSDLKRIEVINWVLVIFEGGG